MGDGSKGGEGPPLAARPDSRLHLNLVVGWIRRLSAIHNVLWINHKLRFFDEHVFSFCKSAKCHCAVKEIVDMLVAFIAQI